MNDVNVYMCGAGGEGQLGHGCRLDSHVFIPISFASLNQCDLLADGVCEKEGEFVVKVACSGMHSAAVTNHDRLFIWGTNAYGQLGTNNTADELSPIHLSIHTSPSPSTSIPAQTRVKEVALGWWHSLAVDFQGFVYAWGRNHQGQLGLSLPSLSSSDVLSPTLITSLLHTRIHTIACGRQHSLAAGTVGLYVWGNGRDGQLGIDPLPSAIQNPSPTSTKAKIIGPICFTPHAVPLFSNQTIAHIAAGSHHCIAIVQQNSLPSSQPSLICGFQNVFVWGRNRYGELGTGDCLPRYSPVLMCQPLDCKHSHACPTSSSQSIRHLPPPLSINWIDCGWSCSAALSNEGFVYVWGRNNFGQMGGALRRPLDGDGNNGDDVEDIDGNLCIPYPAFLPLHLQGISFHDSYSGSRDGSSPSNTVEMPTSKIGKIVCGTEHLIAMVEDGSGIFIWGWGDHGQLGQNSVVDATTPVWRSVQTLTSSHPIVGSEERSKIVMSIFAGGAVSSVLVRQWCELID